MRELTARIRAALRRVRTTASDLEGSITIGDLTLHPGAASGAISGTAIHLTPKEFDLLHDPMTHPGLPIGHARLLHAVWAPNMSARSNT